MSTDTHWTFRLESEGEQNYIHTTHSRRVVYAMAAEVARTAAAGRRQPTEPELGAAFFAACSRAPSADLASVPSVGCIA
jgi:hypothetical protein